VAKWRQEALAIPDEHFWDLSVSSKRQEWDDDSNVKLSDISTTAAVPEGILSITAFNCVNCSPYATWNEHANHA
jgi:hypothetical protein